METFFRDIRYGVRMLRKNPGFTAVAVLALALGIGVNTAIFSLVDEVLWRPLPVKQPDELVAAFANNPELVNFGVPAESTRYGWFSYPDYATYRDHSLVFFSGLAAHCLTSLNLSATEQPARVSGAMVSGNYFAVLGVKAAIGRTILPEEDQMPGSHPVAVLSYEIWKRQFHSDRNVVGKVIKLNGHSFTVVGVLPEAFKGMSLEAPSDIWLPLSMEVQLKVWEGKLLTDRGLRELSLTGRLKPGVTLQQAEAAMNGLSSPP